MKKLVFSVFILFFSINQFSFSQLAMGEWKTHFAYNNVTQITQSENLIFAVSDGTLFSVDKRDDSSSFYSKITGLNGTMISNIGYDKISQKLLIIYTDGNIDLLTNNGIENLPDYYEKQMSADKAVNHILFNGKNAYLSCNFGIIKLNMSKDEIEDTYYIGTNSAEVKVLNTAIFGDIIFAVTASKIYQASLSDPYLISYEHWAELTGLPGSGDFQSLTVYNDYLILRRNGQLYYKKESDITWNSFGIEGVTNANISGDYLTVVTSGGIYIYDNLLNKTFNSGLSTSYNSEYDKANNLFWIAGGSQGVVKYSLTDNSILSRIKPEGPAVNTPYFMKFSGQKLFVLQGGRWWAQYERPGIIMMYENNAWTNIENSSIASVTGYKVMDFMNIAVDPNDNTHFYVPSYGNGVFEFKNNTFNKWYNFTNSNIETIYPENAITSYLYMRMDGGIYDSDGNIWFLNVGVSHQIQILKPDGTWTSLYYPSFVNKPTTTSLLILNQNKNQKWYINARDGAGICVFDDNGTLDDQNDDRSKFYSSFNYYDNDQLQTIIPTIIYTIIQDQDGVIWAGTDEGPLLFTNTENVFSSDFTCSRVKIPRNDGTDGADYLLDGVSVTAIAIDGANRKWIGTETSGVYLMSADGKTTIKHFTAENSPLLSNYILSIAINPVTGEVFIGTSEGLVSYQGDAAESSGVFDNVHAYPNPVREDFMGTITITGLIDQSTVKITDLAGNLVCQTVSNGSLATWDGKNAYGKKVSTGVYLVLCLSPDGQESATTKILVIN